MSDGDGNSTGPVTYTIDVLAAAPVSLPTSTPSSLGPALIGFGYSGAVNASGGSGPYGFTVNGTQVPTSNTATAFIGGNGLTATSSGGNTLFIGGTPTAGPIALTVKVTDGNSTTDTESYTIATNSGPNGANNKNLKGTYSCLTQGFNDLDGARWASVASMVANGAGSITGGEYDENGSDQSSASTGSLSGSYSIGADNNGLLTVTSTPGNTTQWAIALTDLVSPAQQFRMVEADNSTIQMHGTANCFLDTTSAFTASTIGGNSFAFQMGGENSNNNGSNTVSVTGKSGVGRFTASSGSIGNGIIDMAKSGCTTPEEDSFTGTYGTVDANGRLLLTLTPGTETSATCPSNTSNSVRSAFSPRPDSGGSGSQSITLAAYIVDANRMFIMETTAGDGLLAGQVRTQKNAPYSNSSIKGPFVLYMQGPEYGNGASSGPSGSYSQVMQGVGDGSGNITINANYKDDNGQYKVNDNVGSGITFVLDSNNPGRVTINAGNAPVYMYLFGTNYAFGVGLSGNGGFDSDWLEPQVQPASSAPFTFPYIKGTYMMGASDSNQNGVTGEFTLDSSGNITGSQSQGGESGLTFDQPMSGLTAAWDSTTYGTFVITNPTDTGGKGGVSCIAINAQKLACTLQSDDKPALLQFVQ